MGWDDDTPSGGNDWVHVSGDTPSYQEPSMFSNIMSGLGTAAKFGFDFAKKNPQLVANVAKEVMPSWMTGKSSQPAYDPQPWKVEGLDYGGMTPSMRQVMEFLGPTIMNPDTRKFAFQILGYAAGKTPPAVFPGHQFTGYGLDHLDYDVSKRIMPTNFVDLASLLHDIDYWYIAQRLLTGKLTRQEAIMQTRKADQKFLVSLAALHPNSPLNKDKVDRVPKDGSLHIIDQIMRAKMMLEDNKELDPLRFVVYNEDPRVKGHAVWQALPQPFTLYAAGYYDTFKNRVHAIPTKVVSIVRSLHNSLESTPPPRMMFGVARRQQEPNEVPEQPDMELTKKPKRQRKK